MRLSPFVVGMSLALLWGCNKKPEATAEPEEEETAAEEQSDKHAAAGKQGAKAGGAHAATGEAHAEAPPKRFAVPFAWEGSTEEPLARTRTFLRELVRDNEANVRKGKKYFDVFAEKQIPRVTILTCSDSRVQTHVWDSTPDNDDFQIRNIGNQLLNAQGSVEYGVEHLHTPLLLIIGHTGCGAVKAAMGDISKLSEPIQKELAAITLPKELKIENATNAVWAEAVVANVHAQVQTAVNHFNKDVAEQLLTVVGAVYDFRGDLGDPGTLHLVNVNANTEPERLAAFTKAVGGHVRNELGSDDPTQGLLARVAEAARALALADGEGAEDHRKHAAKAAPVAKPEVKAAPAVKPEAKAAPGVKPEVKAAPVAKPEAKAAPTAVSKAGH